MQPPIATPSSDIARWQLFVVVLNYRTPDLVINCIGSLVDQIDPRHAHAVVVDNASGDDSLARIQADIVDNGWADRVSTLASDRNGGFSAGNNIGIRAADADAYLLLNSDTIVRPGAIGELQGASRKHPAAGIIGPRLEWPDGTPQISTFRYRTPLGEFLHAASTGPLTRLFGGFEVPLPVRDEPTWPEWTSFAAVLLRRDMIDQVGELDEEYFMYMEDLDYCRRARTAGWKILNWPRARIVHLRGGTSPVKRAVTARARPPAYYYRSRARYFAKFYGTPGLWMANLLWWLGRGVSLAREIAGRKESGTCEREWLDIWLNARRPL